MKTYICECCQYVTSIPTNYNNHCKSVKHYMKIEELKSLQESNFTCTYCLRTYKHASSFSKHKSNCKQKISVEDKKKKFEDEKIKIKNDKKKIETLVKIETLKMDNQRKEKELLLKQKEIQKLQKKVRDKSIRKEKTIIKLKEQNKAIEKNLEINNNFQKEKDNNYEKQIDTLKDFVYGAGNLLKKSMSSINFANTHYKEALPLTKHATGLEGLKINEGQSIYSILIYYSELNQLHKLIGDFIITIYKKDNPNEQSMWSTDVKRLNYIIRSLCASIESDILANDSYMWQVDKNGIKITEYIIFPIINEIKNIINREIEYNTLDNVNIKYNKVKELLALYNVSTQICDPILPVEINKYIAPHFNIKINLLE